MTDYKFKPNEKVKSFQKIELPNPEGYFPPAEEEPIELLLAIEVLNLIETKENGFEGLLKRAKLGMDLGINLAVNRDSLLSIVWGELPSSVKVEPLPLKNSLNMLLNYLGEYIYDSEFDLIKFYEDLDNKVGKLRLRELVTDTPISLGKVIHGFVYNYGQKGLDRNRSPNDSPKGGGTGTGGPTIN